MARAERCTEHPVTGPKPDCAGCQYRERLAIVLFQKDAWSNREPDAPPLRWERDDDCPEWMRDDYRYQADAALELMLPDFAEAEQRGRAGERADVRAELERAALNAEQRAPAEPSGQTRQALRAMGHVLRSSIEQLDKGSHVGAAERRKLGG